MRDEGKKKKLIVYKEQIRRARTLLRDLKEIKKEGRKLEEQKRVVKKKSEQESLVQMSDK